MYKGWPDIYYLVLLICSGLLLKCRMIWAGLGRCDERADQCMYSTTFIWIIFSIIVVISDDFVIQHCLSDDYCNQFKHFLPIIIHLILWLITLIVSIIFAITIIHYYRQLWKHYLLLLLFHLISLDVSLIKLMNFFN